MTYIVKCDNCGKEQEAEMNSSGEPCNPINPETDDRWYSKFKNGKTFHACGESCIPKGEMMWPKWAL